LITGLNARRSPMSRVWLFAVYGLPLRTHQKNLAVADVTLVVR
jgi:hypothetical protein